MTYDEADHSYTVGLVLLCLTAVAALVITLSGTRIAGGGQRGPQPSPPSTCGSVVRGTAIPEASLISHTVLVSVAGSSTR